MVAQPATVAKAMPSEMPFATPIRAVQRAPRHQHASPRFDPSPATLAERADGPRPLEDEDLRDEIELLLELIVIASEYPRHLTSRQVDAALRLPLPSPGSPAERATMGRRDPG